MMKASALASYASIVNLFKLTQMILRKSRQSW